MAEIRSGGAFDDPLVISLLEQATHHQVEALACLREHHDPRAGPLSGPERNALRLRALEHVCQARRLLVRAQQVSQLSSSVLEDGLARLATLAQRLELPGSAIRRTRD
jgi:hypothetical protein